MEEELITPENVSKEFLKAIFDAAFMDASYDSDGDLRVKDQVSCFVFPSERKDRIRLATYFNFKPEASRLQRLECINHINDEYIIVRAIVGDRDSLRFTCDIPIAGGISKKAFILTCKRFCSIPHDAVQEFGNDIVK